ncbi:hypothetical protein ACF081_19975 [Streptomyces longwoodensis]|uniref:hypothetical protein n=1 Tax=Streptomyces longwoodensis TaxID=68231 RepID=UPI0037036220
MMPGPPLAVLGVCLTAVMALVAATGLGRRRRPGAFRGAARIVEGRADGLHAHWRSGYGHWVRDVFEPLACRRPAADPTGITRSPRDHL